MLFFRLSSDASAGYAQRSGQMEPIPAPTQNEVNRLSLDFLDVTSRADAAATKAVAKAEFRAKFWGILVPGLATVILGVVGVWQPMNTIRKDVEEIRKVLDMKESKSRLDKLEDIQNLQKRIDELEREAKTKNSRTSGGKQ